MSETKVKPAIILVAKSIHTAKSVSKLLGDHFEVVVAKDAELAWELVLGEKEISVLVCELALAINQFGLLERIRGASDEQLAATRMLLMVGETESEKARETAFQKGATDFINVPFSSTELITRVRLHAKLYLPPASQSIIEMKQASTTNVLQQLPQEKYFNSRLQQELSFSMRHKSHVSLCKLKLDNIKAIIAGFDKATAMSLVQAAARIIQQVLRREDILCYLGNAEFCILYPATNGIGATIGINRIIKSISERKIRIAGKRMSISLSGAIFSCIATEKSSVEKIHQQLNSGLAQAISGGGNQIVNLAPQGEKPPASIDHALKLIESNATDDLQTQALDLMLTVLPLLELAEQALDLGLKPVIQNLRQDIANKAPAVAAK